MKKLINKIGIITFSLSPIVAIASTSSSSHISALPQFKLAQSFQTKPRKSFKNSKWVEQTQSNSNSNITDGTSGTIFEDSRGNLWSMGYGTPLQKYDYTTKRWTKETSASSNNKITNGDQGTIFEDSRGNLWSMGSGHQLQKYDYTTKRWTLESNDNNITNGYAGTIFEDSRGNLWSMALRAPLQKYDYTANRWTKMTKESSGSNIASGGLGDIFEDSRGNLWSMALETPLQKYDYTTNRWTTETKETSGNNITNGSDGTIFEDSRGNLWSMAFGTPLQKYNYQTKKWKTETRASSNSNITNGDQGTIFEDSRGNLWSMGNETPLQKYDYTTKRWTTETKESSGSNITNGLGGAIFEDSRGNLWAMAKGTPLQKYDYTTNRWTTMIIESNSNIISGFGGALFEDSRGNLWSMGDETSLQKLTPTKENWLDGQKVKDFDIEFKTRINKDSRIAVLIKGYRKYTSDLFTHLRYKKKAESKWKVVKKRTIILDAAEYEFKWVLGIEEIFASKQKLPQKVIIKSNGYVGTTSSFQQIDVTKAKNFLKLLSNQTLSSLANNSKLVGAITKLEVLSLIQAASGYSDLTSAQQALIATEDLILLTEDPAGTLKVTITFKGETYELIKAGFNKLSLKTEANKFQDFTSPDTVKSNAASLKASSKDVLNVFKKISGYQRPTNLTSDIVITKVIVKKALNLQTQKMTFELTISRQDEIVKKDIIVTFKKEPGGLSTGAIIGTSLGAIFGMGIISFLIFYLARRNRK